MIHQTRFLPQAHRSTNKLFEEFVVDKPAVDANGKSSNPVRVTGRAVGARIATGKVRKVLDSSHLHSFKPGEVLVADTTTPDWEPVLKTAAAIVTNRGGELVNF
jgi:phosphoenolpyruvate synthase/pyruvate phosphate dikinase